MSALFNSTFNTDADGFTFGGTTAYDSGAGSDGSSGYFKLSTGTASRVFTPQSSGRVYGTFYFRIDDTISGLNTTHNFYVMPSGVSASSANSCLYLAIARPSPSTANFTIRNTTGFVNLNPFNRDTNWHRCDWRVNVTKRTFTISIDGLTICYEQASANTTYTNAAEFDILGQSSTPANSFDTISVSTLDTVLTTPPSEAVLINAQFNTDADGFTAGIYSSTIGQDFSPGILTISASNSAVRSFATQNAGKTRFDWWYMTTDSTTGTNKNTYLLIGDSSSPTIDKTSASLALTISRDTASGATTNMVGFGVGYGAVFTSIPPVQPRILWTKISAIFDHDTQTFSLYLNDILWRNDIESQKPIIQMLQLDKIGMSADTGAPDTLIDGVIVTAGWTLPTESVLINHDFTSATGRIETLTPTTELRNIYPQPWKIPDLTSSYGAFTAGSNGLIPDTSKQCLALMRCGAEGIFETEVTAASSGTIYMAMMFRVWAGLNSDSYLILRYSSAAVSGQRYLFSQGSTILSSSGETITIIAGNRYGLKIEARGRYVWSYVRDVTNNGSYQILFGGPFLIMSSATGARGQLSEEHAGPYMFSGAENNRIRWFSYTGRKPATALILSVGGYKVNLDPGSVRELYVNGYDSPTRNLFWSKGIQLGHMSQADMGNYSTSQSQLINATNVQSVHQRSLCVAESTIEGSGEFYLTLLRRGPWVSENVVYYGGGGSINFTPDNDLRSELWSQTYRYIDSSGSSTSRTKTLGETWVSFLSSIGLPKAMQWLTNGTNKVRIHVGIRDVQNTVSLITDLTDKFEGNGDPSSRAFNFNGTELTAGTTYEIARSYLIESGSSLTLSDTDLINFRDDMKTPASLTFSIGSLKTDSAGDFDTDGFNERYGWHEVNCLNGVASFSLTTSIVRFGPVFRLNNYAAANGSTVIINSVTAIAGTDYVLDDLGNGSAILQLLSNPSSTISINITPSAPTFSAFLLLMTS